MNHRAALWPIGLFALAGCAIVASAPSDGPKLQEESDATVAESPPSFRVVVYNVLEGFRGAPDRQKGVSEWLARQKPDVVVLLELNGYTEDRLRDEAGQWGHPHAALLKPNGYATGLTSRTPITDVERVFAGFHHGLLRCRTAGIRCFVVHLSPLRHKVRQDEARRIIELGRGALDAGEPVLVLGDFNALSRADEAHYSTTRMLELSIERDKAPHRENLNEGRLDFAVMQAFLDASLADVAVRFQTEAAKRFSYPTPLGLKDVAPEDWKHHRKRIDYILASPPLSAACTGARVVNDASMDLLSDHFPVVADFRWRPPGP